ncbi:GGDEF domain-containing protein [Bacillus infantis]|uniref:GGDEF domain-containing protein n=1 Tax=Bacillus infantis TaxID=324767 RepID=UPI0021554B17|nr:GGDEF domain-containing protein [Bacillus infantis]MCR6610538.1 GGDEF domain-containing protein [Bacillus infantis]
MPNSLFLNDYHTDKIVSYSRWLILLLILFICHSPAAPIQAEKTVIPAALAAFSFLYIAAAHISTSFFMKKGKASRRLAAVWIGCDHIAAAVLFWVYGDGAAVFYPLAILLTMNAAIRMRTKGALCSVLFLSASILAGSDLGQDAGLLLLPLCILWAAGILSGGAAVREMKQKAQIDKLKRMVYTDFLTGLANRRAFHEHLNLIEKIAEPCFILLGDVDNFKSINDHYGHLEGDEVLKKLGSVFMRAEKLSGCRIYRYGGEEFAFLFPGHREDKVIGMLTGLLDSVVQEVMAAEKQSVTMSFGVSFLRSGNTKLALEEADALLYQAKTSGKSKAIFSSGLILKNTLPSAKIKNANSG